MMLKYPSSGLLPQASSILVLNLQREARVKRLVEVTGFEPVASSLRTKRSAELSYTPAPEGSLPVPILPPRGVQPPTTRLRTGSDRPLLLTPGERDTEAALVCTCRDKP